MIWNLRLQRAFWALLLVPAMAVADFAVREASARLDEGMIRIDADIDFQFSEKSIEALENGVPLLLVVEARVQQADAWFWERAKVAREWRYELRFHPLAGYYSVRSLETGLEERFVTREAAGFALGELRELAVVEEAQLDFSVEYEMELRAFLDIESLPLPLRPLAYVTPSWHLSTGWSRWRLRR